MNPASSVRPAAQREERQDLGVVRRGDGGAVGQHRYERHPVFLVRCVRQEAGRLLLFRNWPLFQHLFDGLPDLDEELIYL